MRDSRAALEELTQLPVASFAYPHGAYDRRVRAAVIDCGYRSAAAVKNAASHLEDDPFAIARWTVSSDTTASRIAEVLEGWYPKIAEMTAETDDADAGGDGDEDADADE